MIYPPARWILRLSVIVLFLGSIQSVPAQIPTATAESLSRQAGQVGNSFSIRVNGDRLYESRDLRISDSTGSQALVTAEPHLAPKQLLRDWTATTGEFQIGSQPHEISRLLEVQTVGRHGLSNPRPFLLVDAPVVVPSGDHWSTATALAVEPGTIVNDRFEPLKSNFYRIHLTAQQLLQTVAYAKQLDSLADISIKLWNSHGDLVSSARTHGNWPAEIAWWHSSGDSEDYFLEVSDLLGRGGAQFFYLIENQLVATPLKSEQPLSESANSDGGTLTQLLKLDSLLRPSLDLFPKPERFLNPLAFDWYDRLDNRQTSVLTSEPVREFPASFRGCLSESFAVDIQVEQGQVLVFDVASASLDQLTDPAIVIYRKTTPATASEEEDSQANESDSVQLSFVAEQDDAPYVGTAALRIRRLDPHLIWTAPETGDYRVVVMDNQSGLRPRDSMRFTLEIRKPQPSFSMIAYYAFPTNDPSTSRPRGTHLTLRGTEQIHVSLIRHDGFDGPVEVSVTGLPTNCICHPAIIPAGSTETDLIIQAGEELSQTISNLEVWGVSPIGDQERKLRANLATITAGSIPTNNSIISRRTGAISLACSGLETAPLQVQIGEDAEIQVKRGSKSTVPVKLYRTEGSAAECTLRPQALPPQVTVAETKIPADQSEGSIEINVAGDAPLGSFTFWLQTETKVKWRPHPEALADEEQYLVRLEETLSKVSSQVSSEDSVTPDDSLESSGSKRDLPSPEALESAIATTKERIEQLRTETAEQEISLWLPSNTLRILIAESE